LGGEGKPWWLTLLLVLEIDVGSAEHEDDQTKGTELVVIAITLLAFRCWGSARILLALAGILPASDSTA